MAQLGPHDIDIGLGFAQPADELDHLGAEAAEELGDVAGVVAAALGDAEAGLTEEATGGLVTDRDRGDGIRHRARLLEIGRMTYIKGRHPNGRLEKKILSAASSICGRSPLMPGIGRKIVRGAGGCRARRCRRRPWP